MYGICDEEPRPRIRSYEVDGSLHDYGTYRDVLTAFCKTHVRLGLRREFLRDDVLDCDFTYSTGPGTRFSSEDCTITAIRFSVFFSLGGFDCCRGTDTRRSATVYTCSSSGGDGIWNPFSNNCKQLVLGAMDENFATPSPKRGDERSAFPEGAG